MDPYEIIETALSEAKSVMTRMVVNEGQRSVLDNTIIPNFEKNARAEVSEGWTPVDAGEYSDFMSETVEAGNQIMQEAYRIAKNILKAFRLL